MANENGKLTITASPEVISHYPTDSTGGTSYAFYNVGPDVVRVGFSAETVADGAPIAAGAWSPEFVFDKPRDELWVVSAGTSDIRVYRMGV